MASIDTDHGRRLVRGALPVLVALLALVFGSAASQARVGGQGVASKTPVFRGYSTGVFHWSAVRRADHYEFQLATDPKFNSLVRGHNGSFSTGSTSATLSTTLQDGTYWWRVRGIRKNGSVSRWKVHSFKKIWSAAPALLSPANGASIKFPLQPLLLSWQPVLGAVRYEVAIARDPKMTSLVSGAQGLTTAAAYIPPGTLADGTYYWTVTPVDAEKHSGARSIVRSFTWSWPSGTTTNLQDLVGAPEFVDPLLSWAPVPGAVKYELDVNFSQDFNTSSSVCCSSTTVATGYSPPRPLPNNTYFWRVRPVNAQGDKGVWTTGTSFTQTFDTVPPVAGSSIGGLHVRDELSDGGPRPLGWPTGAPIVVWGAVPGASEYDLNVFNMTGGVCDIQSATTNAHVITPLTAWSPLGVGHGPLPYPTSGATFEAGGPALVPGDHYCVRIRAIGDKNTAGDQVYGDYTFLNNAFTYNPPASATGPVAIPGSGDYLSPTFGVTSSQSPFYTWQPIAGANSYWVIVSRDPSFTNLVDYGFTQIPAFVPRITIADETTTYYWAILPAANADGTGLPVDPDTSLPLAPTGANPSTFQKRSTPPTLLSPASGAQLAATQPQFQWSSIQGALDYRLQVSTDPNFGSLLTNVVTGLTSYVSTTTYPAQSTLYWRVQAEDGLGTPLTWSSPGTFNQVLPTPQSLAQNTPGGDVIPTLHWSPVAGAIGYDVQIVLPGGSVKVFKVSTPAIVPDGLSGAGEFHWQVRAEFTGAGAGPYSSLVSFRRAPTPPTHERFRLHTHALIFSWKGQTGIKEYILQVASRPDFSGGVESDKTDGTVVASLLTTRLGGYAKGHKFYWRVAAVDADGNTSGYSPTKTFRLRRHSARH